MATLDDLPRVEPPLAGRAPQHPIADRGPDWLDAETVERFASQLADGVIVFEVNPGELVAEVDDATFAALFARHLADSPLASPYPLPHRVFALVKAIQSLVDSSKAGLTPRGSAKPPTPTELEIAAVNLESWLLQAAQSDALPEDVTDTERELLARRVALLDVPGLARLTGFGVNQLATWRMQHVGPPFVKLSGQRRSIRYPVAGVVAWLYGLTEK